MTLERFKAATGANITHVPYRGGGAMMPDLISGTVNGAITEFSTAFQLHKGGKAHIIGIAAIKRSKLAPEIPTFIEGGVKDFVAQSYIGIVAPAKTPAADHCAIAAGRRFGLDEWQSGSDPSGKPGRRNRHSRADDLGRFRRLHQGRLRQHEGSRQTRGPQT